MSSPDQLTAIEERITTTEDVFNFLEPDSYGKNVYGIQEFENVNNILKEHNTIKITVSEKELNRSSFRPLIIVGNLV